MKIIENRIGRTAGKKGITIHIKEQGGRNSKSFTVHGIGVEECYKKIKFFMKSLERKNKGGFTILIEED